jgi:hypothetical protein
VQSGDIHTNLRWNQNTLELRKKFTMTVSNNLTSWDILREPNRILEEKDYGSRLELLIYLLTWGVEIGLIFVLALNFFRR